MSLLEKLRIKKNRKSMPVLEPDENVYYKWNARHMNASDIVSFNISFGDYPILNFSFKKNVLTYWNSIRSRDGGNSYPKDFFDKHNVVLAKEQVDAVKGYLNKFDYKRWQTDDSYFNNMYACGYCPPSSFSCQFSNGKEFACYSCSLDWNKDFIAFVNFLKDLCGIEISDGIDECMKPIREICIDQPCLYSGLIYDCSIANRQEID